MSNKIGIGIDLGGSKLAAGFFNYSGMMSEKKLISIKGNSGSEIGNQITEFVKEFVHRATHENLIVDSIGIAVPGIYNPKLGTVWAPNIPGWDQYPLLSEIKSSLDSDIKVKIDSDRACYILGETWKGVAKGSKDAIFLAVGTGIGAGIMINGDVLRGANDIAGAIGWLSLTDSYLHEYKTFGCFEYHASGPGLARMVKDNFAKEVEGCFQSTLCDKENLTGKDVLEAYKIGDPIAKRIIERAIEFWGKASANLVSLFNPEKIIFGGGVFGPASQFINQIYLEAKKWGQPISMNHVKFVPSQFGNNAGLYGAGYLSVQNH